MPRAARLLPQDRDSLAVNFDEHLPCTFQFTFAFTCRNTSSLFSYTWPIWTTDLYTTLSRDTNLEWYQKEGHTNERWGLVYLTFLSS